ncbi:hypothetical protein M569_03069, partial [Genlisea aurea]
MAADTTASNYWLNWRFFLCALWISAAVLISGLIIWKYERRRRNVSKTEPELLLRGQSWGTSFKSVHPLCLLAYRLLAFCCLLALLTADIVEHSFHILYFYTEWTLTLAVIYFGLGSAASLYGCLFFGRKDDSDVEENSHGENGGNPEMGSMLEHIVEEPDMKCRHAPNWEYALQILLQMVAGAVALTDTVFWLVLYPFFSSKDYALHFLAASVHSFNAIFLLGDIILNSLHFPFFRIAYFILWTSAFVVFQWLVHAFVKLRWPYPFLDLSSPNAPIWYLAVGVLHIPCYGIFWIMFKIKKCCLSR